MARLLLPQPLEEPASALGGGAEALRYTGVSSEGEDEFSMALRSPDVSKARVGQSSIKMFPTASVLQDLWLGRGWLFKGIKMIGCYVHSVGPQRTRGHRKETRTWC